MVMTTLAMALLGSSSSAEAFRSSPTLPTFSRHPRGGALKSAVSNVLEVSTTPIPGMRPGTSGLRKKVEVWQGLDDDANKNYVENFIQSLIDTAQASNGNKMIDTYVVHGHLFMSHNKQIAWSLFLEFICSFYLYFNIFCFVRFFVRGSVE
jgi:phosphoglucomutase